MSISDFVFSGWIAANSFDIFLCLLIAVFFGVILNEWLGVIALASFVIFCALHFFWFLAAVFFTSFYNLIN